MNIKGGACGQPANPADKDDEGIFISKINPSGAAARDGRLRPGMRIIEVNDVSLLGATHQDAVHALRNAGNRIKLLICDGYEPGESQLSPSSNNIQITPLISPTIDTNDDDVFVSASPNKGTNSIDLKTSSPQASHSPSTPSSVHSPKTTTVLMKQVPSSMVC